MKITRIRLDRLRNEEWFTFFTECKGFIEEYSPEALHIEALFAIFTELYVDADVVIEKIPKSAVTSLIKQADYKRDHTFRGLADAVKSYRNHFDAVKIEAANRIQIVLDHYSNISQQSYSGETSAIHNFLQELNTKHAADVQTLGLGEWMTELEKNNLDFESRFMERNAEKAAQTDLRTVDVRRKLDRNYLDIVERIEALMTVNGDSAYLPFVKVLNTNIDRYNHLIAQRQGRNAAKKTGAPDSEGK